MSSKDHSPTIEGTRIGRLARFCYDRRKLVLLAWVVAFIVLNVLAVSVKGTFNDKFTGGKSQSQLAQNLLTKNFPARSGDTANAVFRSAGDVNSSSSQAAISAVDQRLAQQPHVLSVRGPFDQGGQSQISRSDPHIAYSVIQFDTTTQNLPKADMTKLVTLAKGLNTPTLELELGGQPIEKGQAFSFGAAEGVGILAAIVILLIAFGSFVAMGLPIFTALFSLGAAVSIIDLVSHLVTVPTFATELAAMIGIGVVFGAAN